MRLTGSAGFLAMGVLCSALAGAQPAPLPIFEAKPALVGLDTEVYPLGWSEDGSRLAYLAILPWEVGDAPTISQTIVDLRTDKVIHEKTWEELSEAGIDFEDRKAGIAAFWTLHGATINELLKVHQIVPSDFRLHTFPGFFGERRRGILNVVLKLQQGDHPIGVVGSTKRGVSQFSIDLIQDEASKTVFRTPEGKPGEVSVHPLAVNVRGYLMHKNENRIAILVALTEVGSEGPPHTRVVMVVGATIGEKF